MLELPDDSTYLEFKFIVDGVWQLSSDYSTTTDPLGNINNTMIIHSQSSKSHHLKLSSAREAHHI